SFNEILEAISRDGLKVFAEKSVKRFFASVSFLRMKEEVKAARKMILSTPVSSICNLLSELARTGPVCDHLERISVPVLILVGTEDSITPPEEAKVLQKKIPGSSLKTIRYSGHLPNMENSFEFNQQLRLFMDKVCRRR